MGRVRKSFAELAQKYPTPAAVQKFLRQLPYNRELKGETCRSARSALKAGKIHCLEGAFVAAAILEHRGLPPLVLNLDSIDNLCHVLFVYQTPKGWGSIGRSRDEGLHGRSPRFKNLRELARSYIDPFIDHTGRITGYALVNLDDTDCDWRASTRNVWKLERHLVEKKHVPLDCSDAHYARAHERYVQGHRLVPHRHWR